MVLAPFMVFGNAHHWAAVRQLSNKFGVSLSLHQSMVSCALRLVGRRMIVMPPPGGFFLYVGKIFINDKIMDTMECS